MGPKSRTLCSISVRQINRHPLRFRRLVEFDYGAAGVVGRRVRPRLSVQRSGFHDCELQMDRTTADRFQLDGAMETGVDVNDGNVTRALRNRQ